MFTGKHVNGSWKNWKPQREMNDNVLKPWQEPFKCGNMKSFNSNNKARFVAPNTIILGDPYVGKGTWIGFFCLIEAVNAPVYIGEDCSIASGVHIYTHSTHKLTTLKGKKETGSVTIGNNVSIGANSVVMHGTFIGDHVSIPALTVVKPYTRICLNKETLQVGFA